MASKKDYGPGDVVLYRTIDGRLRYCRVDNRMDDVKNGKPGFDGSVCDSVGFVPYDQGGCWGYDSDIIEVKRAKG